MQKLQQHSLHGQSRLEGQQDSPLCQYKVLILTLLTYTVGPVATRNQALLIKLRCFLKHAFLKRNPFLKDLILLLGNLNGEPDYFSHFRDLCLKLGWQDIGARGFLFQRPNCDFTCIAPNSLKPTRRDHVLANIHAIPCIKDFRVLHCDHFPVHHILQLYLKFDFFSGSIHVLKKPLNMCQLLEQHAALHPVPVTCRNDRYEEQDLLTHRKWLG